jgi:hypothetical protein
VKSAKVDDPAFMSDGYMSYVTAEHDSVLITNALARMGVPEYVILVELLTYSMASLLHKNSTNIW